MLTLVAGTVVLFAELSSPKFLYAPVGTVKSSRHVLPGKFLGLLYIHLHALYKIVKFRDSAKRSSIHTNLFKNTIMTKNFLRGR